MLKVVHKNKFGLTERDMKTIEGILKEIPEIKEVRIFGSRAKGTFKPGSDVDLAVINEGVNSKTRIHLSVEFDESSLPFKVDLIYLPDLKDKDLIEHIERVGAPFYKNEK